MNKAQVTGVDSYIKELEDFGITFNDMTTEGARKFLTTNTYYEKLRSYLGRTPEVGEIAGLDFNDLVELSRIDFSLSRQVLTLALSIEHALKIRIYRLIELEKTTDLAVCLAQMPKNRYGEEFQSQTIQMSDYSKAYLDTPSMHENGEAKVSDCMLWELLESLSFWQLINLYGAALQKGESKKGISRHYLKRIQELRNAAAHENCLLARTGETGDKTKTGALIKSCHIDHFFPSCFPAPSAPYPPEERKQKELSRLFLHDFCILLHVHDRLVESTGMKEHARCELEKLRNRIACGNRKINNNQTSSCQLKSEINTTLSGVINAISQFLPPNQSALDDCEPPSVSNRHPSHDLQSAQPR